MAYKRYEVEIVFGNDERKFHLKSVNHIDYYSDTYIIESMTDTLVRKAIHMMVTAFGNLDKTFIKIYQK